MLITSGLLEKNIVNPVTNEKMTGCVTYKWNDIYNQYKFEYEKECSVKSIKEVVLEQFPYLEIGENGCKVLIDNNYSYMGGCYISNSMERKYIWYSGFLWQIMGINKDGTIRMISEKSVIAIPYHSSSSNWDNSYVKAWLNNYFYSKLKGNDIITEQIWCGETTTDENSARTTCENNLSKEKSKVGLITLDEYNLANKRSLYSLQEQWILMPKSENELWKIDSNSYVKSGEVSDGLNVRAVINFQSNAVITGGAGTLSINWKDGIDPYILNEDKNVKITGKLNEITTSGEYVLFSGKKYRVVDKDSNGNTKLILDGYYEENGTIFKMKYNETYTKEFSKDFGIGQKLNTDVLEWLVSSDDTANRNKLVIDYTWHQNIFDYGNNYKVSLDETNSIKNIQATVGLIRVGEILSNQSSSILKGDSIPSYKSEYTYWTMTVTEGTGAWIIEDRGGIFSAGVSNTKSIRPVIVIKSTVEIIGGTGTFSNPYQI